VASRCPDARSLAQIVHAILAAPVTTHVRGPTEVPRGEADGVRVPSVINLDSAQLIERAWLIRRLGRASLQTMGQVCRALSIATGCDDPDDLHDTGR